MATPTTLNLLFIMISSFLLVLLPKLATSQFGSMCVSQFALANQACLVIPPEGEEPNIGDSDQVMLQRHRHHAHKHSNHSSEHEGDPDHHDRDDDDDDHDDEEHHEHRQHQHPRANTDCCRWLQEVERSCVCDALRRLPAFLTRPFHSYTVSVGTTCELAFKCDGI